MTNRRERICSLGTGTMGASTTAALAAAGFEVALWGRSSDSLERGMGTVRQALGLLEENGLMDGTAQQALARVTPVISLADGLSGADFIIESVAENLEVKRSLLAEAENFCSDGAVLSSNTSGLSPTAIAAPLRRPERFLVTHFWNPAHLLPLVEVCPGERTTPEVASRTMALLEAAGKRPVLLSREAEGFIGNRLQFALLREAFHIVESGIATMEAVDSVVKSSIGRRLLETGPFESADMGGLDVFTAIASYLFKDLSCAAEAPKAMRDALAAGDKGAKTGKGLAPWPTERRKAMEAARTATLIRCMQRDRERERT